MPSKAKAAKENASSSTAASGKKVAKKRSGAASLPFTLAIANIRKQKIPGIGMSVSTNYLLNKIAGHVLERMIDRSGSIARYDGKDTLKPRHVQAATDMILIGPLASHAADHASKAAIAFQA